MRRAGPVRPTRLELVALEGRDVPATFIVNSTGDTGTGSGLTGDLRYCITQANLSTTVDDTITFDASVFASDSTITLTNGQLQITDALVINGPTDTKGVGTLAVNGNNASRVFLINAGTSSSVTLNDLSILNGKNDSTITNDGGGGIQIVSTWAMLDDCTIENSTAREGGGVNISGGAKVFINECIIRGNTAKDGGGVHVSSGSFGVQATLTKTLITQNTANPGDETTAVNFDGRGGGIYAFGTNLLNLDSCTISHNTATTEVSARTAFGGGIYAITTGGSGMTITNCLVSNNTASNDDQLKGFGGGAYLQFTKATIEGTTFQGNVAAIDGGGVYLNANTTTFNANAVTSSPSVVFGNTAKQNGGGLFINSGSTTITNTDISLNTASGSTTVTNGGGGIYANGSATITQSVFAFNSATRSGGGVHVPGAQALTMTNVTLSQNTAGTNGGGIYAGSNSVTVNNSTIAGNKAGDTTQATGGGGVFVTTGNKITLYSTILGDNSVQTDSIGPDGFGAILANFTLIENSTGTTLAPDSKDNPPNADPELGPLAQNGGFTATHALLKNSPAINTDANTIGLTFDQRGVGFLRAVSLPPVPEPQHVDIGAYELQRPPMVAAVSANDDSPQRSGVTTINILFNQAVTLPADVATAFQLTPVGSTSTIKFSGEIDADQIRARLTILDSGSLTIYNQDADLYSLIDGNYELTVFAASVSSDFGNLDGNADGTGGDNYTNKTDVFRFFGDSDGDRDVDFIDFLAFRSAFGTQFGDTAYKSYFDANGDGFVDLTDYLAFRTNYGNSLSPP